MPLTSDHHLVVVRVLLNIHLVTKMAQGTWGPGGEKLETLQDGYLSHSVHLVAVHASDRGVVRLFREPATIIIICVE